MSDPKSGADVALKAYLEMIVSARHRFGQKPASFRYVCIEEFLLQHGTFVIPQPLPAPLKAMPLGQCFINAQRLARRRKTLHYVEGIAEGVLPMAHAWCVDRAGNVYDPTWRTPSPGIGTSYCGVEIDITHVRYARTHGSATVLFDYSSHRHSALVKGVDVQPKDAWFRRK
jgi:hypothetical protein